jgi:hypothetical protein
MDEKTLAVQGFFAMGPIPDGTYDVFVVDAESTDDGSVRLDLAFITGSSKGEVVSLRFNGLDRDALAMLGTPATLTVDNGEPKLQFD